MLTLRPFQKHVNRVSSEVEFELRSYRDEIPEEDAYTPEEIQELLYAAMDERYALCPEDPMTPEELDAMAEHFGEGGAR